MLTEAQYLDPKRFPLTTRQKLSLENQQLIDSVNCDQLLEYQQSGAHLTPEQHNLMAELKEKLANVPVTAKA